VKSSETRIFLFVIQKDFPNDPKMAHRSVYAQISAKIDWRLLKLDLPTTLCPCKANGKMWQLVIKLKRTKRFEWKSFYGPFPGKWSEIGTSVCVCADFDQNWLGDTKYLHTSYCRKNSGIFEIFKNITDIKLTLNTKTFKFDFKFCNFVRSRRLYRNVANVHQVWINKGS